MQKPSEKLLAEVRELSIAERTYLAAYLDILATGEEDKPKRGRPRKKRNVIEDKEEE